MKGKLSFWESKSITMFNNSRNTLEVDAKICGFRDYAQVRDSMHSAMLMNKTEMLDAALDDFSEVDFYCITNFFLLIVNLLV